jgi:hypothetical protein
MTRAKRKCVPRLRVPTPVLDDEAQGSAALFKAPVLELAELKCASQRNDCDADQPAVPGQGGYAGEQGQHGTVKCMRQESECSPHRHVAQAEQHKKAPMVRAPRRQPVEGIEQRQSGRQREQHGTEMPPVPTLSSHRARYSVRMGCAPTPTTPPTRAQSAQSGQAGTREHGARCGPAVGRPSGSCVEDERALQGVVIFDVEVDAECGILRSIGRGLADKHGSAGHCREHGVGQRGLATGRA